MLLGAESTEMIVKTWIDYIHRSFIRPRWHMLKVFKRVVFFSAVLLLFSNVMMKSFKQDRKIIIKPKYQDELVRKARTAAGCRKPEMAEEYVVCDKLPYSEVSCGGCKKGCQVVDEYERHYLVPDVVHFIWFGSYLNISNFHQYLALRSVASLHRPTSIKVHHNSGVIEESEVWQRIKREIPCIELVKCNAPEKLFNIEIKEDLFKADIARLQILKDNGGIYLDLDVITLKPLDPLRIHAAAVGRSKSHKASNGIIFSERNSRFVNIWIDNYRTYEPDRGRSLAYWGLNVPYSIYLHTKNSKVVYMDEVRFNRPNPYVDGLDSTTSAHFTLRDNYFLHIHPKAIKGTTYDIHLDTWADEELRTLDSVYGQAARIALFGSPDLVYRKGEFYREPYPKRKPEPFPKDDPTA